MSPILLGILDQGGAGGGAGGSYESIATVTVGAGGSSSIDFNSISSSYKHLQIRYSARSTRSANDTQVNMRFNGITSGYYAHILYGDGGNAYSSAYTSQSFINMNDIPAANATANTFNAAVVDILNYTSSSYKTVRSLIGRDLNGSGLVLLHSGLFQSSSTISSITIYPAADNFAQYSSFALYGIRE